MIIKDPLAYERMWCEFVESVIMQGMQMRGLKTYQARAMAVQLLARSCPKAMQTLLILNNIDPFSKPITNTPPEDAS